MDHAHEGFDDGILHGLGIVDIGNREDTLAAPVYKLHCPLEVFEAEIPALQKEFPNAHQNVEFQFS